MLLDLIPAGWLCVIFVIAFVLVSEGGLMLFDLWYKPRKMPADNDVAGFIFGTQSLIYSLILAFVIVAVWNDYEELNQTIEKEADKLNSILSHSSTLPPNIKEPLNLALFSYCNQIINKEWKMQSESSLSPSAIPSLRMMLLRSQPKNKLQEGVFNVLDDDLSEISDLRRERLSHTHSHVPGVVWLILKAGSIMMIAFSYFLHSSSTWLKRVYLFFLGSTIAMSLFLVYMLDHPFNGSSQVSRKPYENILAELRQATNVKLALDRPVGHQQETVY